MTCRSCGASIADKAIVCYRCGTPTAAAEPARASVPRRRLPWWVVATLLMALGGAAIWLLLGWLRVH